MRVGAHNTLCTRIVYSQMLKKKTRMTTFIKTKFMKSDDQTNIGKYGVAAYITE